MALERGDPLAAGVADRGELQTLAVGRERDLPACRRVGPQAGACSGRSMINVPRTTLPLGRYLTSTHWFGPMPQPGLHDQERSGAVDPSTGKPGGWLRRGDHSRLELVDRVLVGGDDGADGEGVQPGLRMLVTSQLPLSP